MSEQQDGYQLATRITIIAAALAVAVSGLMLLDYARRLAKDPLESPAFHQLKAELSKTLKDERTPLKERQARLDELRENIRTLDLSLRQAYFRQRRFASLGGWMLLVFAFAALLSARWAGTLRRKLPHPVAAPTLADPELGIQRIGRWSVAALAGALASVSLILILGFQTNLPALQKDREAPVAQGHLQSAELAAAPSAAEPAPAASTAAGPAASKPSSAELASAAPASVATAGADFAGEEEMLRNWPRFRGNHGAGITDQTDIPTTWNAEEGTNIVWKSKVPMPGNNSPVVWGKQVFLSGADEASRKVFCFSVYDGRLVWEQDVPTTPQSPKKPPKLSDETGFAAPTMATDGRRVFAIFANGDLAAFDVQGKLLWNRSFGLFKNDYGYAASLATYKHLLVVQIDQGDPKEGLSRIYGLEAATGKTVWDTLRPVPASWPSPIVFQDSGRDQLVTCADPWVISYNPADGKELWRAKCLKQDVGPSPVYGHGFVYAANEFPCLSAIKADGEGDVTKTHVVWKGEDGLPDTCSPLAAGKYLLVLASVGTLTCYDAKEGNKLWEHDFDSNFKASPTLVGKYVYLIGDEGKAWVVELGEKDCREVATAELGENCTASPAFAPGKMFLRGAEHLYCIGKK